MHWINPFLHCLKKKEITAMLSANQNRVILCLILVKKNLQVLDLERLTLLKEKIIRYFEKFSNLDVSMVSTPLLSLCTQGTLLIHKAFAFLSSVLHLISCKKSVLKHNIIINIIRCICRLIKCQWWFLVKRTFWNAF